MCIRQRLAKSSNFSILYLSIVCAVATPLASQAGPARIALILDQESPRFQPLVEATQREIQDFFRPGEIELLPPRAADGTPAGVGALLTQTLRDSSVSVVVTLGSIASHLLARSGSPSKPAIAGTIIDAGRWAAASSGSRSTSMAAWMRLRAPSSGA